MLDDMIQKEVACITECDVHQYLILQSIRRAWIYFNLLFSIYFHKKCFLST